MSRAPLDAAALAAGLDPPWTGLTVVEATPSTNADLLDTADQTPDGAVLVAEHQTAGRGRLDRTWTSPPRSGLTFSALLRPAVERSAWGWLPLLAGVALRDAVSAAGMSVASVAAAGGDAGPGAAGVGSGVGAGVDGEVGINASLKWPNDLLLGAAQRKAAGILVQVAGEAAVIGIGLNVSTTAAELPVPTATSLAAEGAEVDRTALLATILAELGGQYLRWHEARGDAWACGLAAEFCDRCATLGQEVIVTMAGGASVQGFATGIDGQGRLVVDAGDGGEYVIAAGDVQHLRAVPGAP